MLFCRLCRCDIGTVLQCCNLWSVPNTALHSQTQTLLSGSTCSAARYIKGRFNQTQVHLVAKLQTFSGGRAAWKPEIISLFELDGQRQTTSESNLNSKYKTLKLKKYFLGRNNQPVKIDAHFCVSCYMGNVFLSSPTLASSVVYLFYYIFGISFF